MPAPDRNPPRGPVAAIERGHADAGAVLGRVALLLAKRRLSRATLREAANTLRRVASEFDAVADAETPNVNQVRRYGPPAPGKLL